MIKIYRKVTDLLKKIDFEVLWPGFHLYPFALYTQHETILNGDSFPTPNNFYGNTTIRYNGQQIAIWNIELDPPENLDLLTASLVHEMFHAFQKEQGEQRFPNDLALLAGTLTPETLAWKIWERRLLANEYSFFHFCSVRLEHRNNQHMKEEELIETAEGMAQFIEYRVLSQLSNTSFLKTLKQCQIRLREAKRALDVRRCGYDSGAYMLWRAVESGINIYHIIGQESKTIFEFLSSQITLISRKSYPDATLLDVAAKLLKEQKQQQESEIDAFYHTAYRRMIGPFQIWGYDPINMWRQGDILFSKGFIALKGANSEMLRIRGNALLIMEPNSNNMVIDCLIPKINP